jgi:glycine/D-amino acid oxidase-like deaminating enzyme
MTIHQQAHASVWVSEAQQDIGQGPLAADASCDVCIVGAGVAGVLTAERLASMGYSVIVLDAGPIAGGETSRTTAHISNALDDRYSTLAKLHGPRGAALAAASHTAAINRIEELARSLDLDCGWKRVDGYLAVNDHHAGQAHELLAEELHAAREAGVEVEAANVLPEPWAAQAAWSGPMLRFRNQGQVHPLRLLHGVVSHVSGRGVRFHTHTRAVKIQGGADGLVETERGAKVRCKHIVVATNTPINDRVSDVRVRVSRAGGNAAALVLGWVVEEGCLVSLRAAIRRWARWRPARG